MDLPSPGRSRSRREPRTPTGADLARDLTARERQAFYAHAVRAAWEDGRLRFVERAYLDRLRRDLGLSDEVGLRLEQGAYRRA